MPSALSRGAGMPITPDVRVPAGTGAITGMPPACRGRRSGRAVPPRAGTAVPPRKGTTAAPRSGTTAVMSSTSATPVGHTSPRQGCTSTPPFLTVSHLSSCVPDLPQCPVLTAPHAKHHQGARGDATRPTTGCGKRELHRRTCRHRSSRGIRRRLAHKVFTDATKSNDLASPISGHSGTLRGARDHPDGLDHWGAPDE
jgi:hypothetical protein